MRMRLACTLALAIACMWTAGAQAIVTENDDGAVVVTIDSGQVVLPAVVAKSVADALREHADDPDGLRLAILGIVREHAARDGQLATAIAFFAITLARPTPTVVDAILRGVRTANPTADVATVLARLPELKARPGAAEAPQTQLARLQATVENPAQISPVQ